jgi:hypothetical protein
MPWPTRPDDFRRAKEAFKVRPRHPWSQAERNPAGRTRLLRQLVMLLSRCNPADAVPPAGGDSARSYAVPAVK